jgi:hypothetical protein
MPVSEIMSFCCTRFQSYPPRLGFTIILTRNNEVLRWFNCPGLGCVQPDVVELFLLGYSTTTQNGR